MQEFVVEMNLESLSARNQLELVGEVKSLVSLIVGFDRRGNSL